MFANKVTQFHKVLKPATELILSLTSGFGDPNDWKLESAESKILLQVCNELKKEMISEIKALHDLSGNLNLPNQPDQERFFNMLNGSLVILMLLCEKELFYRLQIRNAMLKIRDHTQGLKYLTINEVVNKT